MVRYGDPNQPSRSRLRAVEQERHGPIRASLEQFWTNPDNHDEDNDDGDGDWPRWSLWQRLGLGELVGLDNPDRGDR